MSTATLPSAAPPVDIDDLVLTHLGLARSLARRFSRRGESQDDLDQVAQLALVKAARRFDPGREVSFATFATVSVLGELKRHFRDHGWWVRAPRRLHDLFLQIGEARELLLQELGHPPTVADLAHRLEVTEEDILEAMEAAEGYRPSSLDTPATPDGRALVDELPGDDAGFDARLDRVELTRALPTLDPREQYVVKRYYFDECTQAEIGSELGCSQMQVSRLLARSLARLRHRL